jgi:hypothetical protein
MGLSLSDAKLQEIADRLFLLEDSTRTKLTKPTNTTGADSLAAKLDPIGTDARFADVGIGVVDFTTDRTKIWLHNGDDSWRIGSTAKLAMLLAAVQLRDDVRKVHETGHVSKDDFDELFAMSKLWKKSKNSRIQQIAGKDHAPRISTIFDFTKSNIDFFGPDPDTPNVNDIVGRLPVPENPAHVPHLTWPTAQDFEFSERLWLAGARSDNVAATTCISEIGVDYIKAVQRAYALFDPGKGMHLLLAGPYSNLDTTSPVSHTSALPKFRVLRNLEFNSVKDATFNPKTKKFDDQLSWEPGSAAALTAYMIALMNNQFVTLGQGFQEGKVACTTIQKCLSNGLAGLTTRSAIADGVKTITTVSREITKIGLLGKADGEPGALNCEFVYLETQETDLRIMKYGVVVTGIRSKPNPDGSPGPSATKLTQDVGKLIHQALLTP